MMAVRAAKEDVAPRETFEPRIASPGLTGIAVLETASRTPYAQRPNNRSSSLVVGAGRVEA
jgi:hypothetical protein